MNEPLTDSELAEIERTATDLREAIRLDDSIAGWPERFDDDFHEALDQDKAIRLVSEIRRLRAAIGRGLAFAANMEDIGKRLAVRHGTADAEAAKVLSDQLRHELKSS